MQPFGVQVSLVPVPAQPFANETSEDKEKAANEAEEVDEKENSEDAGMLERAKQLSLTGIT